MSPLEPIFGRYLHTAIQFISTLQPKPYFFLDLLLFFFFFFFFSPLSPFKYIFKVIIFREGGECCLQSFLHLTKAHQRAGGREKKKIKK